MNIIDFIIFSAIKTIVPILLLLIPFFIWLFLALNPKNRAMVKIKFDYRKSKTSFYSKGIVFAAIFFWLLILFVGISQSDPQTTIFILGLISSIYIICIIRYLYHRHKQNLQKKKAHKIPGKIVGIKQYTSKHYSYKQNHTRRNWHARLIVEYENPYTFIREEYITKEEINCNPFYYLKSLDVTVYYQDSDHIRVDDFKRIKRLSDNIAYQVTGKVDGNDPGVLRYEEWEK